MHTIKRLRMRQSFIQTLFRKRSSIFLLSFFLLISFSILHAQPAFPGAEGFGARASGGRGGNVIYVTNLNANGPGSLREALETPGKRYILFNVSGVIPAVAHMRYGDCTIAGQTSPGGIYVRGFLADDDPDFDTPPLHDNWILRFVRSRPDGLKHPDPTNRINDDALRILQSRNVIIDHCSFARAEDECVQLSEVSGVSIQHCVFAETPGDHSYFGGMLINYTSAVHPLDSLSIHHNNWNRIEGRVPEISRESPGAARTYLNMELSNNLIWDNRNYMNIAANTGQLSPIEPLYYRMNIVGNHMVARDTYTQALAEDAVLRDTSSAFYNSFFVSGNSMARYPLYRDYDLFYCCNDFQTSGPSSDPIHAQQLTQRLPFPSVTYTNTDRLIEYMISNVGCFPRDTMDKRLIAALRARSIDLRSTSDTSAMPDDTFILSFNPSTPPQPPIDSDADGMPDQWEIRNGLNPSVKDHNGLVLSRRYTGVDGYTNLECYLNALADSLITGSSISLTNLEEAPSKSFYLSQNYPNPVRAKTTIAFSLTQTTSVRLELFNLLGRSMRSLIDDILNAGEHEFTFDLSSLPEAVYVFSLTDGKNTSHRLLTILRQ